jgi:UPF0271 protein
MPRIDLNADIGEGLPPEIDLALLDLVTSANIACGVHAGDESTMARTIRGAAERSIRIGAHPSYPDRANFGRVSMTIPPDELRLCVIDQVREISKIAEEEGATIAYIKPHGALYNDLADDREIAEVVISIAKELGLPLMALAGSPALSDSPVPLIAEGFLDRGYMPDGFLVPRSEPGAVLTNFGEVEEQALLLARKVDSLCIHSDTPGAIDLLRHAIETLLNSGYEITSNS